MALFLVGRWSLSRYYRPVFVLAHKAFMTRGIRRNERLSRPLYRNYDV